MTSRESIVLLLLLIMHDVRYNEWMYRVYSTWYSLTDMVVLCSIIRYHLDEDVYCDTPFRTGESLQLHQTGMMLPPWVLQNVMSQETVTSQMVGMLECQRA